MMSINCLPKASDHASDSTVYTWHSTIGQPTCHLCNLVPIIGRYLYNLVPPALMTCQSRRHQAVIRQSAPRVSKWDPHDTSLVTCRVCLDKGVSCNKKGNSVCDKANGVSEGGVCKLVNKDEVVKNDESKMNDNKESNRGVWNIKFTEIISANKIDNKLVEIFTKMGENGNEVVILNDEMIEPGCEKWKNTICGFFMGGQVTYSEARYHLRRMWNKFGFIDLMKNEEGVFFFKFQDERGMDEVVSNGPWLVKNKPMFVQKWRVGMVLDRAEPSKLSVWVKMLNVPMEAWSVKGISALASNIGKPIIMDDMTAKMHAKGEGRLSFARVLIEIEARKKLKEGIEVVYKASVYHEKFTKIIQVEYVWKPPCCEKCKVFGHDERSCMFKEKELQGVSNDNDMNNAERPFKVKHDNVMGSSTGENNRRDNNSGGSNGTNEVNLNNTKSKSTMISNSENCSNLKKAVSEKYKKDARQSSSNRFSLLDELVGENELIPPIEQRKMVDEYMSRKNAGCDIEKKDEDVECESQVEEGIGLRNEVSGKDRNVLV
ncbi:zinc knuckle CX2CX4HX4C containing protein [Tanacetum coccineum]|uniref:Zinc knuckle CX2CX4HX4C containing protein n=1 Tax=Tanacetum coccineum TaxID=301880 RepID=A0ABQ5IKJ2_9ASTR